MDNCPDLAQTNAYKKNSAQFQLHDFIRIYNIGENNREKVCLNFNHFD